MRVCIFFISLFERDGKARSGGAGGNDEGYTDSTLNMEPDSGLDPRFPRS